MNASRRPWLLLQFLLCISVFPLAAQENVTTVGIQIKPIFSNRFFDAGNQVITKDYLSVDFAPRNGYSLGMVIRRGLSDRITIETGINYVRRRYRLAMSDSDSLVNTNLDFSFISYEIPVQALFFVKLGKRFWMNGSGGIAADLYASDVFSSSYVARSGVDYDFEQRTFRNNWIQIALLANYGFEYRTPEKGYLYLGFSYHRPFNSMAVSRARYIRNSYPIEVEGNLSGNYLTVDFRYFFHENPQRKKSDTKPPRD